MVQEKVVAVLSFLVGLACYVVCVVQEKPNHPLSTIGYAITAEINLDYNER
jgi:uncharacterized membrane protein YiaA